LAPGLRREYSDGMVRPTAIIGVCVVLAAAGLPSCRGKREALPPPDARRPALKTEAELAAERTERIARGEVVPNPTPLVEAERRPALPPPMIRPSKDSIRGDVLMVNNSSLTVAEALYPLRDWIREARAAQTPRVFADQLRRRIRDHVRQEIGSLLVYEKALGELGDPQREALEKSVDRELERRVSQDFGDSQAQFERHLERHGLTREQYRGLLKRQMVVGSYVRDVLAPDVSILRHELLAYYRDHLQRYCTEETRELLMIELPFEKFLPAGVTWQAASEPLRAQARLQAIRRARAAHEALAQRDFRDVAREYSLGLNAESGGSWGPISQPLQPPYDEPSRHIFDFVAGQYSEPVETPTGICIVGCGRIEPGSRTPFADVQQQIRTELENARFNRLASDYIWRLAEKATISDLEGFINVAVERAAASAEAGGAQ